MERESVKSSMMYAMLLYISENSDDVRGFLKSHPKITSRITELVDTIGRDKTFNKLFKKDDDSEFVMFISRIFDETEKELLNAVKETSRLEKV